MLHHRAAVLVDGLTVDPGRGFGTQIGDEIAELVVAAPALHRVAGSLVLGADRSDTGWAAACGLDRLPKLVEGMEGMLEYVNPMVNERLVNSSDDFISVLASGEKAGPSPLSKRITFSNWNTICIGRFHIQCAFKVD